MLKPLGCPHYFFNPSLHPSSLFTNVNSFSSFFLERNMLSFFLKIMNQKCGSYVCVQLLQTLNILFENIRNETSICKYRNVCTTIQKPIDPASPLSLLRAMYRR